MLEYSDTVSYPSKVHIFSWLCSIFTHEADLYKAMGYGIAAEKALNRNSTDHELSLVNIKLGSMYTMQGKYDKALQYFGNILAQPERYSATINIYAVVNSYCNALRKEKRNDEVLPWLQKFHQRYPARLNSDKCYYHLTLAHTYNEMNSFEPAEKNFLEAIRYSELDKSQPAFIYSYLGALYHKFNHHEKALSALKIAEKGILGEDELAVAGNFTYMSQSEAALGNYENAYFYLLKSKVLSDSIYDVSKEKHTQELEVRYQTQKKEADLRLKEENIRFLNQHAQLLEQGAKVQQAKLEAASLLSENNEIQLKLQKKDIEILTKSSILQQAQIERADAKRRVTVLIIVLLAVIIALLVWLFWTKLRSNKVITNKNGLLQQLLKDKSWLLREMHHRIKNNLHIIMNLLEFQSTHLHDDALEAIKNSQSRIFSMSLIHQKLYQTDDEKTIDMVQYIPELVSYLRECFSLKRNFRINMDIAHTAFHVTEAVPLGLIINEAVTNSMKHAFKNNLHGEISISLKASGANEYELIMADNGTGLSEDFDIDNANSLGFQLIKGLSDQLEAKLHIVNENGLKIVLSGISAYKALKFRSMENELNAQMTI
jgi:two-component system, sensor histidine kinase PdtaS